MLYSNPIDFWSSELANPPSGKWKRKVLQGVCSIILQNYINFPPMVEISTWSFQTASGNCVTDRQLPTLQQEERRESEIARRLFRESLSTEVTVESRRRWFEVNGAEVNSNYRRTINETGIKRKELANGKEQMGSLSVREWKASLLFRYSRDVVVCDVI